MGFLDKLSGRKRDDKQAKKARAPASKPPSAQARTKRATSSKGELSQVYVYVGATRPVDEAMANSILSFALEQLKADTVFRQIFAKVARDKIPIQVGRGTVSSMEHVLDACTGWLQTEGISLTRGKEVMGKRIFVHSGDSYNPADGSKFKWTVIGCFQ